MKSLGLTFVALATVAAVLGCSKRPPSDLEFHSLGVLNPGQSIDTSLQIQNPFDEPAFVTGLSDACSVRVSNHQNGILAAREGVDLQLLAQASRMPGPNAFKLEVTFSAGRRKVSTFHSFRYEVPSEPLLSVSQVWTGTPGNTVDILGLSASEVVSVQSPPEITAKIHGKRIEFSGGDPLAREPVQATVVLRKVGSQDIRIPIDVISVPPASCGRIYPDHIWTNSASFTAQVIGLRPPVSIQVQPQNALTARIEGDHLFAAPRPAFAGPASITVTSPSAGSATLEVWVAR